MHKANLLCDLTYCYVKVLPACPYYLTLLQVAQLHSETESAAAIDSQALKLQSPPCPWEFYICKVLQGRLPPASRSLFLNAQMLYLLPDHSAMLTPFGQRGTLQDLLNSYLRKGKVWQCVAVCSVKQSPYRWLV